MLGQTVELLSQLLWGRGTIALTLLCGLYFTVGTGFLPLTRLPTVLKRTVGSLFQKRDRKSGGVSPFAAVSTALGGTMGVGNIVGVGAALALGGAGSIFWMWIGAFLGMMTKYAEVLLAVRWRQRDKGAKALRGGPMYYISCGIPNAFGKALAVLFCVFCALASFSSGSMTQTGAIAEALQESFSLPPLLCAAALTLLCGWVLHGGCDRAVRTCSALVPLMSVFYLLGCGVVLLTFRQNIPDALTQIVSGAFSPASAAAGGVSGFFFSMRVGIARGIFTHEAGLGSASIAHACSGADSPVEQGFWGRRAVLPSCRWSFRWRICSTPACCCQTSPPCSSSPRRSLGRRGNTLPKEDPDHVHLLAEAQSDCQKAAVPRGHRCRCLSAADLAEDFFPAGK